jgi:uncharacterized metal-binding protein (TIGR02443 family)
MAYSTTRRFVAGAVCPRCSEMDKLVVYNDDGKDFRECVACGYKEEMRFKQVTRELETRVNQTDDDKSDVQVLNILSSEKNSKI